MGRFFHYTSLDSFYKIIESKCLRFSSPVLLNDTQEVIHGLKLLRDKAPQIPNISSAYPLAQFVFCLSDIADDLSQWRAYGDNGKGICLEFEINKENFKNVEDKGLYFAPITYYYENDNKLNDISGYLENLNQVDSDIQYNQALLFSSFVKVPAFEKEEEVRLLFAPLLSEELKGFDDKNKYNLSQIDTAIKKIFYTNWRKNSNTYANLIRKGSLFFPYIDLPLLDFSSNLLRLVSLKKVYIGPTSDLSGYQESVQWKLLAEGFQYVLVQPSSIPYRL